MLAAASAATPVVVVLDDLHWAEKSTLGLLRHLIASPVAMRVLVLGTYRDSDISHGDPLSEALAGLWRAPGTERLALDGLDDRAVLAMLKAAAGYDLDDDVVDLAHALRRDTDGNPFFAREIVRHLAETGAIFRDVYGRWHANLDFSDAHLPASVREVVGQRVARLSDNAQRVMSTAAVVGRDFDLDLMARLTDRSADDLLDLLDEAIAAAVIAEVPGRLDRFTFAHALIQRALYEDLGAARRGRVHRRVAEALEDICGPDGGDRVGELARHWAAASAPVEAAKAIDYARLAGDRALSALAPDEAIGWYSQALELLGRDATTGSSGATCCSGSAPRSATRATPRTAEPCSTRQPSLAARAIPNGWWPPRSPITGAERRRPVWSTPSGSTCSTRRSTRSTTPTSRPRRSCSPPSRPSSTSPAISNA